MPDECYTVWISLKYVHFVLLTDIQTLLRLTLESRFELS